MKPSIAVVGMGHWGKNLVRNFHALGALHSVCDTNPAVKDTLAENYPGVQYAPDLATVLNDSAVTAVALASPAVMHFEQAMAAMQAGKDVYVEKPLAINVEDGRKLVDYAEANGRILMVGHILRYHPAVKKLKELIDSGELGRVQYVYSNRLSMGKIRVEENILWSFAPHDISVILDLLGTDVERVACHGRAYLTQQVADSTLSVFQFQGGVQAHIYVSWLHPFKEQRMVVVGSEKMAVFEDTAADKLRVYPHKIEWKGQIPTAVKAEAEVIEFPSEEPLKNECQHFIDSVTNRSTPVTDGREGLRVLQLLNLAQKSLEADGEALDVAKETEADEKPSFFAHPQAIVHPDAKVGAGTKIWQFSHIMKNATIGKNCVFGQNCGVEPGVIIGDGVKAQNNVTVYTGTEIEDYVFLGPSCVLTNVTNPRSEINRHSLYEKTFLRRGCSIGANATIVCGIEIGRYAFIGSGAVVAKHVPDYALMVGVPARQVGWVSRHGLPLKEADENGVYTCPESGLRYKENEDGQLRCLDLDEEAPLPDDMRQGEAFYDDIVHGGRLK